MSRDDPDFRDECDGLEFDAQLSDRCHLCRGTGEINALTDQNYIFVASYATCPLCDGSGEAP